MQTKRDHKKEQSDGKNREPRWARRPDDRPHEILEAALEVFAERGYRAARLDEVAARAGVTKGTIYLYFKSKEDLLRETVLAGLRAIEGDVDMAATAEGSTWDKLRLSLEYGWTRWIDPQFGRLFRLIIGEAGTEHPRLFEEWSREGPLHHWDTVSRLIEEGQQRGEFRRDIDAKAVARVFAAGMMLLAYAHVHTTFGTLDAYDTKRIPEASLEALRALLIANHLP